MKQAPKRRQPKQAPLKDWSGQLELLWDELLSRQPERVRAAYNSLDLPGQKTVLTHLNRMASEVGWQSEQRLSALAAIHALKGYAELEEK